jgi:hypothetical protein
MADTKISALTGATTPLAGTEVLPIVQGASTVKVAVSDLTAGRAISATTLTASTGNITSTAGNFVVGTSGKGIDFTATSNSSGTMTSELLNDYEEGSWTPTLIGGTTNPTLTYGLQRARYTKIGQLVTVSCYMSWSALSGGSGQMRLDGLPFTVSSAVPNTSDCGALMNMNGITLASGRTFAAMQAVGSTTYCVIRNLGSAVNGTTTDIPSTGASGELGFTISYVAA